MSESQHDAAPSRETVNTDLDWLYDFAYSDLIGNRGTSLEHDGLLRIYKNYRALYLAAEVEVRTLNFRLTEHRAYADSLEAENQRQRAALEQYADAKNWHCTNGNEYHECSERCDKDGWWTLGGHGYDIAREALKEKS